jgi:hypothetical protein
MSNADAPEGGASNDRAVVQGSTAQDSSYGGGVKPLQIQRSTSTVIDQELFDRKEAAAALRREDAQLEKAWKREQEAKDRDARRRVMQGVVFLICFIIVVFVAVCVFIILDDSRSDKLRGQAFTGLAGVLTVLVTAMAGYAFGRQSK